VNRERARTVRPVAGRLLQHWKVSCARGAEDALSSTCAKCHHCCCWRTNDAWSFAQGPATPGSNAFILLLSTAAAYASVREFSDEMKEAGIDIAFHKNKYAAVRKN
jgi:hypothetical protein